MTSRLQGRLDKLRPRQVRQLLVQRCRGESDESFQARVAANFPCVVDNTVPCESVEEWLDRYAPKEPRK
jgi:hypothetical protein